MQNSSNEKKDSERAARSVLLVDADRDQARLHQIVLHTRGLDAVSVHSASKALGVLKESLFDVIVVTEEMLHVLRESKPTTEETRVIVVKTSDELGNQELFDLGADFVWHLGDSPRLLVNQVEHLICRAPSSDKGKHLRSQLEMEIVSDSGEDDLLQSSVSSGAPGSFARKIPSRDKH